MINKPQDHNNMSSLNKHKSKTMGASMALMGVMVAGSMISGGVNAADQQKQICKQTDDTYKAIAKYAKAQSALANVLRCLDEEVKEQISHVTDEITDIVGHQKAAEKGYQDAYNNMELIVVFVCLVVFFLLLFKRLGFLEF
jgi:hypothetical protein